MRGLLALAILVPVVVLFLQVRQTTHEKLTFGRLERHGIEYLQALAQVTTALTNAQSSAITGRAPTGDTLTRAVDNAAAVDQRYGDELRSHDRWAGVRGKIEVLPSQSLANPIAVFNAYSEASSLLLALYGHIRDTSQLVRDPDADSYYLEDGVVEQLPQAIVSAGQLADLIVLAPLRQESDRAQTVAELIAARAAMTGPTANLTGDLQSAVDGTESRTLSGNLLSRLDIFQQRMDTLAAVGTPPTGNQQGADARKVTTAWADMQQAASELTGTLLLELDTLISKRIDGINGKQRLSIAMLVLATLLAFTPLAVTMLPQRGRPAEKPGAPPRRPDPRSRGNRSGDNVPSFPPGPAVPVGAQTAQPARMAWERSGAAR